MEATAKGPEPQEKPGMWSRPASTVVIINQGCPPECAVCSPVEWNSLPLEQIEEALDLVQAASHQSYIGMEAFADLKVLRFLLARCRERGITPLLLTRGQFTAAPSDLRAELRDLRRHGEFHLLLVLDHEHHAAMPPGHLNWFLANCTVSDVHIEILFLLKRGEILPTAFLDEDEVNKFSTIHTRTTDNVLSLFAESSMLIAGLASKPAQGQSLSAKGHSDLPRQEPPAVVGSGRVSPALDYPLTFRALVLETTYFCNAKCAHCYTTCGPEVSQERLSVEQAKRIIDQAADLPNVMKRCHIGGGEATVYWDELIEMLAHAKSRGFVNSIVTNGWWGKEPDRAARKLAELKEAGVTIIEFSISAFHREYISSRPVATIVRAAKKVGVGVMLRIATTRSHRASEVLAHLTSEEQRDIVINAARVVAVGRAGEAIPSEDLWTEPGIPLGSCHAVLNLTVNHQGNVFPCCTGSELCPPLRLGNCFEQSFEEMMKGLRGNFAVRALVHMGPAYYAALIAEAGLGHKLLPQYGTYCHLCNQIFTDPELSEIVLRSVNKSVTDTLLVLAGNPAGA